jgi:pilus assembly protein Flp/PilA
MTAMKQWMDVRKPLGDERGAVAIEYGLLAALIAVAFFAGAQFLGESLTELFNEIGTFLTGIVPIGGAPAP